MRSRHREWIKQLLQSVMEQEPGRQREFLREACADDESLQLEIESMLARHAGSTEFLESPALQQEIQALPAPAPLSVRSLLRRCREEAINRLSRNTADLRVQTGKLPNIGGAKAGRRSKEGTPSGSNKLASCETTSGRLIPWWMAVIGLSYVATFVLNSYLIVWGPAQLKGFVTTFSGDAMVIRSVDADSEVAKAGLRAGDRVHMIDSQNVRTVRDWVEATGNSRALRPQRWVVSRSGEPVVFQIIPPRATLKSRLAGGYLQYISLWLPGTFLGFLIAWRRPTDPVGRIGAWFLLTVSIAFGFPHGWAAVWRTFPPVLQSLLWFPQLSRFVAEGIFLSFFVIFPYRLATRCWVWLAIWGPVLATLPWRVKQFYGVIHPGEISPVPEWILTAGFVRTMLYLLIGIVILAVSYYRFLDIDEKRRLRVLMLGTAVSLISSTILVWFDTFLGRMTGSFDLALRISVPFNCAFPLCLAYAILRHRVLDISLIIRQGLQYALARGAVMGFVPALGALFILDLAMNRQQSLADIFRSRGWIYLTLAGLSLLAYWKRREWLESIDRRFFRERYNAQKVLREVVGEVRACRDFQRAAPQVVERIGTALHPEFAGLMVCPAGKTEFRAAAVFPSDHTPPPVPAESKLIALLHVLGKPLEVLNGNSNWLEQRLPPEEREFARRSRIDLLVPIAADSRGTKALLALGVKRSEEPYTRDDQELLETIAESLALLLEKPTHEVERPRARLHECPECGACCDSTLANCPADSVNLIPMPIPRTLAGRYRLERRRGKGGMGTVYEATDDTLDRRVAVKLIRDDWVNSIEAVHRFRREARAAAGFAHPNVVTIYDYGVEGETHAYLVMELLEGSTLREELSRQRRLEPSRLVDIFRGVCAAVEAAHQRQLIHRDLKPENIFIAQDRNGIGETVKVLDFGLAKFLPSQDGSTLTHVTGATQTGVLVGTPAYMSPEQLRGEALNVLWDLWALAVVAYEALTGALPFAARSVGDWRQAVISGSFVPLNKHFDDPSDRWQSFFARSFAVESAKRAHSISEFFGQLEQAIG